MGSALSIQPSPLFACSFIYCSASLQRGGYIFNNFACLTCPCLYRVHGSTRCSQHTATLFPPFFFFFLRFGCLFQPRGMFGFRTIGPNIPATSHINIEFRDKGKGGVEQIDSIAGSFRLWQATIRVCPACSIVLCNTAVRKGKKAKK